MGRERQKKKNRSSVSTVKSKRVGRTKAGRKKVNFLGNAVIEENWDRKMTMSQNYKRLGLSSRLNSAAGGTQKNSEVGAEINSQGDFGDSLAIPKSGKISKIQLDKARVERDPETGHILRIIRPETQEARSNHLNDLLNDVSDDERGRIATKEREGSEGVVAQLEAQAEEEAERLARTKTTSSAESEEEEWVKSLVGKHGDNVMAMVRDRKLNPMQQTEGDIKRRVKIWRERQQQQQTNV